MKRKIKLCENVRKICENMRQICDKICDQFFLPKAEQSNTMGSKPFLKICKGKKTAAVVMACNGTTPNGCEYAAVPCMLSRPGVLEVVPCAVLKQPMASTKVPKPNALQHQLRDLLFLCGSNLPLRFFAFSRYLFPCHESWNLHVASPTSWSSEIRVFHRPNTT